MEQQCWKTIVFQGSDRKAVYKLLENVTFLAEPTIGLTFNVLVKQQDLPRIKSALAETELTYTPVRGFSTL